MHHCGAFKIMLATSKHLSPPLLNLVSAGQLMRVKRVAPALRFIILWIGRGRRALHAARADGRSFESCVTPKHGLRWIFRLERSTTIGTISIKQANEIGCDRLMDASCASESDIWTERPHRFPVEIIYEYFSFSGMASCDLHVAQQEPC